MRKEARKTETCTCPECKEGSKWFGASANLSAWRQCSTCGKFPFPDLENPADGITPNFNLLRCSLLPKEKTKKRKRQTLGTPEADLPDYHPPFAGGPCDACGWEMMAPNNCSVEMSLTEMCSWTEKLPEKGPRGEAVYGTKTGTRKQLEQLIDSIRRDGKIYYYHKWVDQWTNHQEKKSLTTKLLMEKQRSQFLVTMGPLMTEADRKMFARNFLQPTSP
jgi:hypothetical protein